MKHSFLSHVFAKAAVMSLAAPGLFAGDFTACDKVLTHVRSAVEAEPAKVLVIVEDAMVANEGCACEIVKAAILASHANEDLVKQIMLTATNVAPNQSSLIGDCAGAAYAMLTGGGKEVKQVIAVQPLAPADPDYRTAPPDIRGVYLIQPAAGGIVTEKPSKEEPPKRPPPPPKTNPLSPSTARSR